MVCRTAPTSIAVKKSSNSKVYYLNDSYLLKTRISYFYRFSHFCIEKPWNLDLLKGIVYYFYKIKEGNVIEIGHMLLEKVVLKSVHFKKPVTRISFLSKCCHFF